MDPHHDHGQDGLHPLEEVVAAGEGDYNNNSSSSYNNNNNNNDDNNNGGGGGGGDGNNHHTDIDVMKVEMKKQKSNDSGDDVDNDYDRGRDEMKAEQQVLLGKLELGPDGTLTADQLQMLNEARDKRLLEELGGIEAVAHAVGTDLKHGLTLEDQGSVDERMEKYGENVHKQPPSKSIVLLFIDAIKDPMLLVLLVLAVVSIVLGVAFPENESERVLGWIEGAAIICAVLIVSVVTAFNDWSKERKFRQLNAASKEINVKVLRGGEHEDLLISRLLVGDVVELETGDQVPADGLVIDCFDLKTDESVMTGETDLIKKSALDSPFLLSGCHVAEGNGRMLVTAVGPHSEWGKTLAKLADAEESKTPLEEKLERLAGLIGKMGVSFAVTTFAVLVVGFLIKKTLDTLAVPPSDHWHIGDLGAVVRYVIICVTIVVVAVPEGLPLAVTISLAYSVQKMMKDNNLVRHLAACETMGGATNICSDKTGTLTLNQMRVVQGWFADALYSSHMPTADSVPGTTAELLVDGIAVNSSANLIKNAEDPTKEFDVQGNKTEAALLVMVARDFGRDYQEVRRYYEQSRRLEMMYTFSSKKKRMSCIVRVREDANNANGANGSGGGGSGSGSSSEEDCPYRLYSKGASEIVLGLCSRYLDSEGSVAPMGDEKRAELERAIVSMATQGLRTICLAYKPLPRESREQWEDQELVEQDMICIAIVGIKDPLRPEVPGAVAQCKKSGIMVRMVTGDNVLTAQHIARDCGILDDNGIALEGPDFRRMSDEELDAVLPRLQVLARSSPTDKHRLVTRLKKHGEVVAVTGDGTNDAPALKEADVGLAMGLSGTQVAKEASDIIILDDNFKSIVQSVLWGRSIFENIRKFLVFQLTVNIVALVLTVITAITSFIPMPGFESGHRDPPLTAVQLLWVNLIMDTFAALALATEPPLPDLLDRKPYGRRESLITTNMWIQLLGQSFYQLVVLCVLYYAGPYLGIWPVESNNSVVFNSFVFCQIFNEFNARKINHEYNIFENILASPMFIGIVVVTAVAQFLIVTFGGPVTQTVGLSFLSWVICVVLGAVSIPWGMVVRFFGQLFNKLKMKRQIRKDFVRLDKIEVEEMHEKL